MTNRGKNEDVSGKIWEYEFDLWILHIKIRLYGNFDVNLWANTFDPFLGYFWLIEAKMKIKMKNIGKWVRVFNSPYQNWVIWQFRCKSVNKKFSPIFGTFLTNRGKNENEDEKMWENEFDKWILHIKIRLNGTCHKKYQKNFFSKVLPPKHIVGQKCRKG